MKDTAFVRRTDVNLWEDFEVGRLFRHRSGRTVTSDDSIGFATMALSHEPAMLNAEYARNLGYRDLLVDPLLVFAIVLGLSVADLSESGGPFLGATDMTFPFPVHPGDTLYATSVVLSRRLSASRPGWGIVEWKTAGSKGDGTPVVQFRRTNLVRRRGEETV